MAEVFYEKGKKYNCRVGGKPYFRTSVTVQGKLRSIYGDGEKDAKRKKEELLKAASLGLDISKKDAKVGEVFEHWLYNIKRVDKDIKPSSFCRYETTYRTHIKTSLLMNKPLSTLTSSAMQVYITDMYEKLGKSTATIQATLKIWRMFISWAIDEGYLSKNPCSNLSIPGKYDKKKKEIITFNADERTTLLNYMEDTGYMYDTIIKLAFATGMRLGELLALQWEDIGEDYIHVCHSTDLVTHVNGDGVRERYREVWEPKTQNSDRIIPLLDSTKEMLEEHRKKQAAFFKAHKFGTPDFVFTNSNGGLIDNKNFSRSYQRLLKNAGIEYRKFHCIRHTFATEAIRRGVNVKDLQMLMGHSEIETTYIYVQADNESKKNAIERMGAII